jgi:hypothetical protein
MNGPQDVGGRHGFGAVVPEDESIRFHADWEKRVLGVTLASAALGYWNIDASRHARESLPPAIYYNASYYEIWLRGLEILCSAPERFRRRSSPAAGRSRPVSAPTAGLPAGAVPAVLEKGGPTERPGPAPRFKSATASARAITSRRVTPGCPDTRGAGRGSSPRSMAATSIQTPTPISKGSSPAPFTPSGSTRRSFSAPDADPTLTVSIDAWEPYLESA